MKVIIATQNISTVFAGTDVFKTVIEKISEWAWGFAEFLMINFLYHNFSRLCERCHH